MSSLDQFIADHGALGFAGAAAILLLGGFVKGAVGFALPLIAVSGLGMILPAQTAVAMLIVPMLVSNLWQGFRDGGAAAWETLWKFRLLLAVLLPSIAAFSQFLAIIDDRTFYVILGTGVTIFALTQLAGWRPTGVRRFPRISEAVAGFVGGVFGGLAGIWGPPVTLYLIALESPKQETMRALGVIFGLGAVALTVGQVFSGVLNATTAPLSAFSLLPVLVGMGLGFAVHDRLNQDVFRRVTLAVLLLTGLNLLRRAIFA